MRVICLAIFLCIAVSCYSQKADSVAEVYAGHSLQDLDALAHRLTSPFQGDREKFRAIYKWVCNNIEYDYEFAKRVQGKRSNLTPKEFEKWNEKMTPVVIQNLISSRTTVCSGYAWLVRELSRKAGLTCEIVDGYSRSARSNLGGSGKANHSWNAVLIDGQWRLCDPLWSAGYMSSPETFTRRFEESYFLADPAVFILNHYPLKIEWSLLDSPPSLDQFLNGPLIYAEAFRYEVIPVFPNSFKVSAKANESVSFQVKTASNDRYAESYTFRKRGVYVVHFVVNDKNVVAYEVDVR